MIGRTSPILTLKSSGFGWLGSAGGRCLSCISTAVPPGRREAPSSFYLHSAMDIAKHKLKCSRIFNDLRFLPLSFCIHWTVHPTLWGTHQFPTWLDTYLHGFKVSRNFMIAKKNKIIIPEKSWKSKGDLTTRHCCYRWYNLSNLWILKTVDLLNLNLNHNVIEVLWEFFKNCEILARMQNERRNVGQAKIN